MALSIDLQGETAWVTGGASGIGASIVHTLAAAGARVVALDRARVAAPPSDQVLPLALDVGDTAAVDRMAALLVDRDLAPDILVNAAGITRDGVVWKLTDEEWREVVEVNLLGTMRLVRAAAPRMRARRRGVIVNIASINGLRGKFGQSNYAASKGGVIAFTRAVAVELARDGIRVNAVAPGFIDTPMTRTLPAEIVERARREAVLGRIGTPQDVANAVLFLVSPLAAHVTGQVLVVDGGQTV
jgi:NAD(P)-dependent dehydrogenase (short-subunit alcohol dehydrogenase family)